MRYEPIYYDRDGNPISMEEWSSRFRDLRYKRVALTEAYGIQVSTVWLGLDHGFGLTDKPLIFESMVFGSDDADDEIDTIRTPTETAALEAHHELVARYVPGGAVKEQA